MGKFNRRKFLGGLVLSGAAAAASQAERPPQLLEDEASPARTRANAAEIDFRYAPRLQQATICFPDDSKKSLVGQAGDLRYGFAHALLVGMEDFSTVCTFSLAGMQNDRVVRQWLEAPNLPIVHTLIERPTATLELTAFATRHASEGRVDNVLMKIVPKQAPVAAVPRIHIRTCSQLKQTSGPPVITINDPQNNSVFLLAAKLGETHDYAVFWEEAGYTLYLPHGEASHGKPLQYFVRFPQEGQSA
jgi:hypothetical protein